MNARCQSPQQTATPDGLALQTSGNRPGTRRSRSPDDPGSIGEAARACTDERRAVIVLSSVPMDVFTVRRMRPAKAKPQVGLGEPPLPTTHSRRHAR